MSGDSTARVGLVDTHAHLDDPQLSDQVLDVLERAEAAGVSTVIAVGTTAASSKACCELSRRFSRVFAAVGIQPNYVAEAAEGDWAEIEKLAASPGVVAIGETGLDCYWDHAPLEMQIRYFQRHVTLASELGLPFIVHMRDSGEEIVRVLRDLAAQRPLSGVMHSFTGDGELLEACLALGLSISFAGMLTFKKSEALREVARKVPAERLLIETDSPYLTPHPHRGQRPNEPAMLVHTAACLAEIRGVTLEELSELTTANADRLFGLSRRQA